MADQARIIAIHWDIDAIYCRQESTRFAHAIGFDDEDSCAIAIAVSELVTNALKYAGKGRLAMRKIEEPQPGIEVVVEDEGPGITHPDRAMLDGYSRGHMLTFEDWFREERSLGSGLGAVDRLMDELELEKGSHRGLRVAARKWLRSKSGHC